MTVIFAGLDNVITYFHAEGTMDVGRWPRLLLALSGLTAGILFDIHDRRYMNLIMYCVTVLSVLCLLIILSGGLFLTSLIIFYLSAGFFAVFLPPVLWPTLSGQILPLYGLVLAGQPTTSQPV